MHLEIRAAEETAAAFKETRVEYTLLCAPLLTVTFSEFLALCVKRSETKLLDRPPVADLFHMFYLLKNDFGVDAWDSSDRDFFPPDEGTEKEAWQTFQRFPARCRVGNEHPWTYLRDAWKAISGQSLPERRNPQDLVFRCDTPQAHAFRLGVTYSLLHLQTFRYFS